MDREFFLIRHAQSMGNVGIDKGYNPGLSPDGHRQAEQCADFLKGKCGGGALILSSPFLRCIVTSEAIAKALSAPIMLEPALHEYFKPEWFPLNKVKLPGMREIAMAHPMVTGSYDNTRWWPEKSETEPRDVMTRVSMLRNRLLGRQFKQNKIICVGHWFSVAALIVSMCPELEIIEVANASVSKINYKNGKCSPVFINEFSFISGNGNGQPN